MIALSLHLSAMVCAAEHELTTDILVVGASSAGLSAAVQGAESGKKVILLEKTAWWVALPPLPKDCSRLTCSIGSK
ncbi:FAD-dependent oxidoreductase [uncultured Parasutterella sp.]|uniref:FAD-dependent oxidoreductase n=1 Tax=uncultured Parasutterella sp. TaxID=1263098 RepID=UPI0025B716DF|nr:FAD-dependent oxidoreductase [uncultured Parasutterella sp.]